MSNIYKRLKDEIIDTGLCTHCGTCVGLSNGKLVMEESENGPIPMQKTNQENLNHLAYDACPGKGLNYPELIEKVFSSKIDDWRIGHYNQMFIGYSLDEAIRRSGASGGIITNILVYLLNEGLIDGAVVVNQGHPKPWLAEPIIATTEAKIIECAQSVYVPIPVNTIISEINNFEGNLAFVGLPDQVSSIRYLQSKNIEWSNKVKYIIGPYVGTNLYAGAIKSFIKSHGFKDLNEIKQLKFRDGEWPGYLKIIMNDGSILKSQKFYYNYLIPFYITKSSLLSVDFSNELTDISVGDAWSPKYENLGEGYSVIVSRTSRGRSLLDRMHKSKYISLEKIDLSEAIAMHGHMIDFKKRGAFIRFSIRKFFNKKVPDFGYEPEKISIIRIIIELFISTLFFVCSLKFIRALIIFIPIKVIGPLFNFLRIRWKSISRASKRKGLDDYNIKIT